MRDEDANEQQTVAQDADHKGGEEAGEDGRVAVDALDQLAKRVRLVERRVQAQAVQG